MYLTTDADSDFCSDINCIRAFPDESERSDADGANLAWMDVKDLFQEMEKNPNQVSNWIRDNLRSTTESILLQMIGSLEQPDQGRSTSLSVPGPGGMHSLMARPDVATMRMNGSWGDAMPYIDPMFFQYQQQQAQLYYVPQATPQHFDQSLPNLRFRFPVHVLSLYVRTSGSRLHRDKIVSIGAALMTVMNHTLEPQVLQLNQYDFLQSESQSSDTNAVSSSVPGAKAEADAIREFNYFLSSCWNQFPDLYIVSENPTLEIAMIELSAGRAMKEFCSILQPPQPPQPQRGKRNTPRNSRRDVIDLQSFASGLLRTDCGGSSLPPAGSRWATLREFLEWFPSICGMVAPGVRSDVEDRLPFPRLLESAAKENAANHGWMFLQSLCLLAARPDYAAGAASALVPPFGQYSNPLMVSNGGMQMPVQYPAQYQFQGMMWQQQQPLPQQQFFFPTPQHAPRQQGTAHRGNNKGYNQGHGGGNVFHGNRNQHPHPHQQPQTYLHGHQAQQVSSGASGGHGRASQVDAGSAANAAAAAVASVDLDGAGREGRAVAPSAVEVSGPESVPAPVVQAGSVASVNQKPSSQSGPVQDVSVPRPPVPGAHYKARSNSQAPPAPTQPVPPASRPAELPSLDGTAGETSSFGGEVRWNDIVAGHRKAAPAPPVSGGGSAPPPTASDATDAAGNPAAVSTRDLPAAVRIEPDLAAIDRADLESAAAGTAESTADSGHVDGGRRDGGQGPSPHVRGRGRGQRGFYHNGGNFREVGGGSNYRGRGRGGGRGRGAATAYDGRDGGATFAPDGRRPPHGTHPHRGRGRGGGQDRAEGGGDAGDAGGGGVATGGPGGQASPAPAAGS